MLTKLTGGKVYDPAHGINGEVRDIYIRDGHIIPHPRGEALSVDQEYDCRGKVIMAGAIDMHTHIGGGKVTIARNLLPEDHRGDPRRCRPCCAFNPDHRLSLCGNGLHRRV